ncbi:MAG: hypothetical protein AAB455_02785 [Patescibacteria group bacterium]
MPPTLIVAWLSGAVGTGIMVAAALTPNWSRKGQKQEMMLSLAGIIAFGITIVSTLLIPK